jgi:negative regulator of sigma E activity
MLTILSDTQVRTLSDSIETIDQHLATIRALLADSQTVNFDGTAPAVKTPAKAESQTKTHKSRRKYRVLNTRQVLEIKRRLANGETATSISRDYKAHITTINSIKWGKTWKHVTLQQAEPVTVHA